MAAPGEDLWIGRILVRLGHLTPENLVAAVRGQEEPSTPPGEIFVTRGLVTSGQLLEARNVQQQLSARQPFVEAQAEAARFAEQVLERRLAAQEQVNAGLSAQDLAWEQERQVQHLGDLLAASGALDAAQIQTILQAQRQTLGTCKACQSRFGLGWDDDGARPTDCPVCGGQVVPEGGTPGSAGAPEGPAGWVPGAPVYDGGPRNLLGVLGQAPEGSSGVTLPSGLENGDPADRPLEQMLGETSPGERYVVDQEIARGGMGVIFAAADRDIRRQVAMKVLQPKGRPKAEQVQRFIEEAQLTGQLEHPNIIPIHELGVDSSGNVYFTMKLVRGKSLGDFLRNQHGQKDRPLLPAQLSELLNIFLKICDGVAFAHSKGVIHRDLKPSNIMVGQFGEVLVMDWGLAKVKDRADAQAGELIDTIRGGSDVSRTLDGLLVGTASYMPPEQAAGDLESVDKRSDVYSLGAVLYELLTLLPPFRGHSVSDVIFKVAAGRLESPDRAVPRRQIPKELAAISMKALAPDPEERYASVPEMAADVRRFLEGRAVSAKEDSFSETIVKLVRRNKPVFATAAAAAVLLALLGGAGIRQIVEEKRAAQNEKNKAQEALEDYLQERRKTEKLERERTRPWMTLFTANFEKPLEYGPVKDRPRDIGLGPWAIANAFPLDATFRPNLNIKQMGKRAWTEGSQLHLVGQGNTYLYLNRPFEGNLRLDLTATLEAGREIALFLAGTREKQEWDGYSFTMGGLPKLQRCGINIAEAATEHTLSVGNAVWMRFEKCGGAIRCHFRAFESMNSLLQEGQDRLEGTAPLIEYTDSYPLCGKGHEFCGIYVWNGALSIRSLQVAGQLWAKANAPVAFAEKLMEQGHSELAVKEYRDAAFSAGSPAERARIIFSMGAALLRQKKFSEAYTFYERFAANTPPLDELEGLAYRPDEALLGQAFIELLNIGFETLREIPAKDPALWPEPVKSDWRRALDFIGREPCAARLFQYLLDRASRSVEDREWAFFLHASEIALAALGAEEQRKYTGLLARAHVAWGTRAVDKELAMERFKKALELQPSCAPAWGGWGRALLELGRYEEALEKNAKALELDPKHPGFLESSIYALTGLGRDQEALAKHQRALQLEPKNASAWESWGRTLMQLGRQEEALEKFEKSIEIRPNHATAYAHRSAAKKALGDEAGAAADQSRAREVKPESLVEYSQKGHLLYNLGRLSDARTCFEVCMRNGSAENAAYAHYYLLLIDLRTGKAATEVQAMAREARAKVGPKGWLDTLFAYFCGELSESKLLLAAESQDPAKVKEHLCEAYYYTGVARLASGDREGAKTSFGNCIATGVKSYLEYVSSKCELERLRR